MYNLNYFRKEPSMTTQKFNVAGMTCAACQANVTRTVSKLDGVDEANVSLLAGSMTVSYQEDRITPDQIIQAVTKIGYGASSVQTDAANISNANAPSRNSNSFEQEWKNRKNRALQNQKQMKKRLISSAVLLIPLMYIAM